MSGKERPSTQEKIPDRRIQRTRRLVEDAVVALIIEKGYADVTVQDVLDRANIGRSTFYAHFRDKDDVLASGFGRVLDAFRKAPGSASLAHPGEHAFDCELSLYLFRHLQEERRLFRALIGHQGGNRVVDFVETLLTQAVERLIAERLPPARQTAVSRDVLVFFVVHTYMDLLIWWLDHDLPYTPEQMDDIFWRLVTPTLKEAAISG